MLLVCEEHVEIAIDIVLDKHGQPPELLTMEQAGLADDDGLVRLCARCERPARYVVR